VIGGQNISKENDQGVKKFGVNIFLDTGCVIVKPRLL